MATSTETTPLLETAHSPSTSLPRILPGSTAGTHLDNAALAAHVVELAKSQLEGHPVALSAEVHIAYVLVNLLSSRLTIKSRLDNHHSIWEVWSEGRRAETAVKDLEGEVDKQWADYLHTSHISEEIHEVLWTPFPSEIGSSRGEHILRVVDLLETAHDSFQAHAIVQKSLTHTWSNGRSHVILHQGWHIKLNLDSPKSLHILELIGQVIFIGALVSYLLHPTTGPSIFFGPDKLGIREVYLMAFSLASITRPWSWNVVPFILVATGFASDLPHLPSPPAGAFDVLCTALILLLILIHTADGPGHFLLLSPTVTLPTAIHLARRAYQTITPVVALFGPVFLVSAYILSVAMDPAAPMRFLDLYLAPTPIQTRNLFLTIFVAVVIVLVASVTMLSTSTYDQSFEARSGGALIGYPPGVIVDARKVVIRAALIYGDPARQFFPTPVNIVHSLLVGLPRTVIQVLGFRSPAQNFFPMVERTLWWTLVAPFAAIMSLIMLPASLVQGNRVSEGARIS